MPCASDGWLALCVVASRVRSWQLGSYSVGPNKPKIDASDLKAKVEKAKAEVGKIIG